jgi:hypothetical protein
MTHGQENDKILFPEVRTIASRGGATAAGDKPEAHSPESVHE